MKKALTVFLMLALVGSVFAAEPVADVNIAEFSGNASVQWGVDLDAGKTGFKNAYQVDLKLNLLNSGSKSTTGDGVWGELVIKTDEDSFIGWRNGDDKPMVGDAVFPANTGMTSNLNLDAYVDVAKIHFGSAYIGIKRGDTQTGELKMDAAIRSSDDDQAKWLTDVGPDKFSQGIVAGFDHDMFNIAVDLRSYAENTLDLYKITVKDSDGNVVLQTYGNADALAAIKTAFGDDAVTSESASTHGVKNQYTNAYAFAAEAEFTGVENLSVKAGVSYNFSDKYYADAANDAATPGQANTLGFSASAGYKLALDDTYYIRPQIGFTGTNVSDAEATTMDMAFGLLFGWGDIGIDANAGVPFLDDDMAKKVSPGVGVVAVMPLVGKVGNLDMYENGRVIRIMPSFFSGEIVPNLTAAAYSDILLPVGAENAETGFAVAVGAKYAIAAGDMTVTPNMGIRFANNTYNGKGDAYAEKDDPVFGSMGVGAADDDYLNLKAGVDVTGLIDNTTLSVIYESRNLLNSKDYTDPANPEKLGTLNFKAKIAL